MSFRLDRTATLAIVQMEPDFSGSYHFSLRCAKRRESSMNSITRNVNDSISMRVDNIVSGLNIDLLMYLLGDMRCLHQVCFVRQHGQRVGNGTNGSGLKRYAFEPAPTSASPQPWHTRLTTRWVESARTRRERLTEPTQLAG